MLYKHPWSTHTHALAELLLPAFVRNFLDTNVVADTDNLVDQASMQALAMRSKFAFMVSQSSLRGKVALTVLPGKAELAMLLDTAFFVIVLWIVGTTLAGQVVLYT